jgi:hypothetical protein
MTIAPARALVALAVTALALVAPAAHATDPAPTGTGCRLTSINDGAGHMTGELNGGPVVAPGFTVTLRCSVHVGNFDHSGSAVVSESSAPGPGVAVLEPRAVSFPYGPDDFFVEVCTEATVGATTWYRDDSGWTTDPGASCGGNDIHWLAHAPGSLLPPGLRALYETAVDGALCLVFGDLCDFIGPFLDEVAGASATYVDPILCPLFVAAAPGVPGVVDIHPDGDLYVAGTFVWDCPPYEPST